MSLTRGMEPCWCWRQLSLVTDRMGSHSSTAPHWHWVYSAGTTNQFPAWSPLGAVTDRRCGDHQRPNRSWTKHKEGSVFMHEWRSSEERQNQGLQENCITDNGACLMSIIKVVNCRIGNVSQANLQLPRDTITGSLAQLPLDNIGQCYCWVL